MRRLLCHLIVIVLITISQSSYAQVSGIVFRDYDGNGIKSTLEPGIEGVIVNAYNASDVLIATVVSTNLGTYNLAIASATQVRIEFVLPTTSSCGANASIDYSSLNGNIYGTSVQFVTAPVSNVNYAINAPKDYTGNVTVNIPQMFTTTYVNGDPLPVGSGNKKVVHKMAYDIPNASTTLTTSVATAHTVGSVWGVAASSLANRLFVSSVLRRHAGYGPLGSGGIYMLDPSGTNLVTNLINLDALGFPTNGAGAYVPVSVGAVVSFTPQIGSNVERGLPATNLPSRDIAAFEQIGKVGLGGIGLSDDGRFLYVVNLYDKKLYEIDLQNAKAPIAPTAANIRSWAIPNPSCVGGESRPWALKINRGKIFVGVVCDAQVSQLSSDLKASIYEFNPNGAGAFGAEVFGFPLSYTKGTSYGSEKGWHPWTNDFSKLPYYGSTEISYPQPILSDIEVDDDGSFILGFLDRAAMQTGVTNYSVDVADNAYYNGYNGGDILRAYKNHNTCSWELETNAKEGASSNKPSTAGANNNEGPGGGEFYSSDFEDHNTSSANETSQGGLCLLRGSGEVVLTVQDPLLGAYVFGFKWLDNTTGLEKKGYGNLYADATGTFGKAAAMGDIELLLPNAPIEFGNRIWLDGNSNGIQDANEAGISGVSLEIFVDNNFDNIPDGVAIGTTTTNANGEWYFNNSNIVGDADPNTLGLQPFITPNIHYILRIGSSTWSAGVGVGLLLNKTITSLNNIGAGIAGHSDNDAVLINSIPQIGVTAGDYGQNNHNLDFGFKPTIVLPIKIISFTALPKGNQVQLEWKVTEQINVANYEVQTSTDGITFKTIVLVAASSSLSEGYGAIHQNPVSGLNYYRIKSIDKDGSFSYNEIRKVMFGKAGDVILYPNPVSTGVVNIVLTGNMINRSVIVNILSIEGKLISKQQIAKTSQTETIDVSVLASGRYVVKIVTDNEVVNKTIQVVRK
jgi:hypothetical protein